MTLLQDYMPTAASLARRSLAAIALCGIASCAPGGDLPVLQGSSQSAYTLGAGDELRLIVYGDAQLSGTFRVSDQGDVAVPLLGEMTAARKTPTEFGDAVATELQRRQLILKPSVSVDVEQYRPLYILGEVEHPGAYPYEPGLTMLSAVALAGGFTYRSVTSSAEVVRTRNGAPIEGRVDPDTLLQPGDVLTVFERVF